MYIISLKPKKLQLMTFKLGIIKINGSIVYYLLKIYVFVIFCFLIKEKINAL